MKRIITIAAAMLLFAVAGNAQTYFNVGGARCDNIIAINGIDQANLSSDALFVGVSKNLELKGNLGLEAGVNFIHNFHNDQLGPVNKSYLKTRYNGLMVPIELNYKFDLTKKLGFTVFAGPTLHYGLTDKSITVLDGEPISTLDYFKADARERLMLAGSVAFAAVLQNGIRVKIGYSYGLTDKDKEQADTMRQNMLSVTAGFAF